MKRDKNTIEEFLNEYSWETREIVDNISGLIFQEFPNVKEKIFNSKIIYKNPEFGNFLELKVLNKVVMITHLKNKVTQSYSTVLSVDLEKLKLFFK